MLPLTFENPSDYDKVGPMDKVSLKGLTVRVTAPSALSFRGPASPKCNWR